MSTLIVNYSCDGCDAKDEQVVVRARTDPSENVNHWMDMVVAAIAEQHRHRHLFCHSVHIKDLKIPLNKDEDGVPNWVGKPVEPLPLPGETV